MCSHPIPIQIPSAFICLTIKKEENKVIYLYYIYIYIYTYIYLLYIYLLYIYIYIYYNNINRSIRGRSCSIDDFIIYIH